MQYAKKADSAVSPVIGTILMVALTVILVGIIAATVMPMVGGTTSGAVVGVQVTPSDSANCFNVVFTGGDYAKITALRATVGGDDADCSGTEYPVVLGQTYIFGTEKTGLQDVKLIAMVNGNEQIIYSGKITIKAPSGGGGGSSSVIVEER